MQTDDPIVRHYYTTTSRRGGTIDPEFYRRAAAALSRRLGHWLPHPEHRVLDLGCGLGILLYATERIGCRSLTGVNLCEEELAIAARFINASFFPMDIREFLQTTHERYDWIGCLNILEHLPRDHIVEVLRLCRERLTPGGTLVAMVPNALSPFSGTTRYWDFTHRIAFAPNNFHQLASLLGYAAPEFRECAPVPHGVPSATRWILWQAIRVAIKGYLLVETADTKGGVYTMDMLVRLHNPDQASPEHDPMAHGARRGTL